jgi:hypothetical protein
VTVANNQLANQTTFNNAFVSRTTNSSTVGKIDLNNTDHTSVTDAQRELVAIARYTGKTLNSAATDAPSWTSNFFGASGDSLFDRVDSISLTVDNLIDNQVLFGKLEQSASLYYSDFFGLGIGTSTPEARLHVNGSICLTPEDVSASAGVIDGFSKSYLRVVSYDATPIETLLFLPGERILLLSNESGGDIVLEGTDNIDIPAPLTWADKTLLLMVFDSFFGKFRILSGGGGGSASLYNNTFTGTSITATADAFQKWRYTGGSAQTLATLDFSAIPDGGRIIITGSSDTNTLTFPVGLTNVSINGERTLYQYSTIELIKDNTQLIEVSRNGI